MQKNELLTKNITTLIKQIAIPSSIGMFFNTMYNVVDTFYVGKISTVAITALFYSFVVFFMILSISFGLSSATTALVGNSLGKHKKALAKIFATNSIGFFAIASMVLMILGFIFLKDIFEIIGAKEESLKLALEYTYVILLGTAPMLMGLGINAILVATGDTKSYRNTLILGFLLNLILDPLFIYGFGFIPSFGFIGVAMATVLIQFVNFFYMYSKLKKTDLFHNSLKNIFSPNIKIYKEIISQAIPQSLNMFLMSLGTMLVTYFISQYGYKAVAAFGIGFRVEQIFLLPMLGLNTAVATIVANNFGAKLHSRIQEVIKKALFLGFIMSIAGIVIIFFFGAEIISLFDKNMEVVKMAYEYSVIESIMFFAFITIFVSNSTLQGLKQPFIIPYISFYRQILLPSLILYIVVKIFHLDIIFVWISMAFIVYSAAIFTFIYTKNKVKKCFSKH